MRRTTAAAPAPTGSRVLYLALGGFRIRAALDRAREFALAGHQVLLVVPDTPAWRQAEKVPGVARVVLGTSGGQAAIRAADRLLASPRSPLPRTDLLVAGDAVALPVGWRAVRRRPGVRLVLEPSGVVGRRTSPAELAVVTPWYPSPNNPFAGAFVQASTDAVREAAERISILHTEDWTGETHGRVQSAAVAAADRLLDDPARIPVLDTPEGELTRVPVVVGRRRDYAAWVAAKEQALRKALPTGRIEAPVIHAHTGIYGGVLAMRLGRPDARIVVTEHATFLSRIFEQRAAKALYERVLERADAFLCVGSLLRDQLADHFPQYAEKVQVLPNVIDFDRFAPGQPRDPRLLRWLYLGRLVEHKGVDALLEAFARVAADEPGAALTMVGSGARESALRARAAELGLGDRFTVLPPVAPEEVDVLYHRHDLLVHPSWFETFGMTLPEAVATGMPVLAARSHGPAETMRGVEELVGGLMDVSEDPQVIVDAYRELRGRVDRLDLPCATEELKARYGREVIGARLAEVYRGGGPALGDDDTDTIELPWMVGSLAPGRDPEDPEEFADDERDPDEYRREGADGYDEEQDEPEAPPPGRRPGAAFGFVSDGSGDVVPAGAAPLPTADAPAAPRTPDAPAAPRTQAVPLATEPAAPPPPGAGDAARAVAPDAASRAPGRVVLLAVAPGRPRRVSGFADYLVARGVPVDLVTADRGRWAGTRLDPRVRLLSVQEAERRLPGPRIERFLVFGLPRRVLARAERLARRARSTIAPETGVAALRRKQLRASDLFHQRVYQRARRLSRPRTFARLARRHLLAELRPGAAERVFVCDEPATVLGWQLARRYPHLDVSNSLDQEPYARLPLLEQPTTPTWSRTGGLHGTREVAGP